MEQNNREAARSVFISLTAAEVIWGYVDSTLKICADNRISVTLKLCRAIKAMRVTYNNFVEKSLDRQHRENVREAAKAFQLHNAYNLTVMRCTIANALNRKYRGEAISLSELRVNALCSIVMLRALRIIPGVVSLPQVKDLDEIMEAFVAPYELDLTQNVELCQKILARRLMEIEVTEP